MQSLTQQFLDFCRSKPSDETFNPWSAKGCAGYQFLNDAGYPVASCWVTEWTDSQGVDHDLPEPIGNAISWACDQGEATFGALADRLSRLPSVSEQDRDEGEGL